MKRGGPLKRKTALVSRSTLDSGTGLRRGRPLVASSGPARTGPTRRATPARTGPSGDVVALVEARDGVCVDCGKPGTAWDRLVPHHRRNRRAGGSKAEWINQAPNLIMVHASENLAYEDAVGDYRAEIERRGLKLRDGQDPALTPVLVAGPLGRRWFLLGVDGSRTPIVGTPGAPSQTGGDDGL